VDTSVSPNVHYPITYIDPKDYILIQTPRQKASRPDYFTIFPGHGVDSSGNSQAEVKIYPTFDAARSLTLWYRYMPAAMTSDNDVPLFRDHRFLILALANSLFQYLRDPRYDPDFIERKIPGVRANMYDTGSYRVRTAELDRGIFKRHRSLF